MGESTSQIIGLSVTEKPHKTHVNSLKHVERVLPKTKKENSELLNYVKRKTTNRGQLGNIEKESTYYGVGVDYKLSHDLEFSVDVTAEIDSKDHVSIIANQTTVNFTYNM